MSKLTGVDRKIVEQAREILSVDANWAIGAFARDGSGDPVEYAQDTAVRWCTAGALCKAAYELGEAGDSTRYYDINYRIGHIHRALMEYLPSCEVLDGVVGWNDDAGTRHEDVGRLLDQALAA